MLEAKYSAVITIKSNVREISVEVAKPLSDSAKSGLMALEQYNGVHVRNDILNPNDFNVGYSSVYDGENVASEIKDLFEKENIPNIKIVGRKEHAESIGKMSGNDMPLLLYHPLLNP